MFNKKDEMCVCFERYFLAMGNSLEDFWSINKKYICRDFQERRTRNT